MEYKPQMQVANFTETKIAKFGSSSPFTDNPQCCTTILLSELLC